MLDSVKQTASIRLDTGRLSKMSTALFFFVNVTTQLDVVQGDRAAKNVLRQI